MIVDDTKQQAAPGTRPRVALTRAPATKKRAMKESKPASVLEQSESKTAGWGSTL